MDAWLNGRWYIAVHMQAIKSVTFRNCSHNMFHVWLLVALVFPTSNALEVGIYSFEFIAIQVAAGIVYMLELVDYAMKKIKFLLIDCSLALIFSRSGVSVNMLLGSGFHSTIDL